MFLRVGIFCTSAQHFVVVVQSLSHVPLFAIPWLPHARLPCLLLSPRVCSNSCPLSQWCHSTISSCVITFSCPQSFPASQSFPMSWLFALGAQNTGTSASVLPVNIQGWFPLGLTDLISLLLRESQESSPAPQFIFFLIYCNWRLITLQYCSGFYHTLTWISHGCTCVPHPEPPSHLPSQSIPQGHPSAPALSTLSHASNLIWRSISYMIIYMFQCYSLRSSHPRLLPQSPSLFFTSVSILLSHIKDHHLNSIYMEF